VLHAFRAAAFAFALLAGPGERGDAVVPGVAGSGSATVTLSPEPPPSTANPSYHRPTRPPPPVPEAAGAADLRGLAAIQAGDCEAAIRAYDEALAIAPGIASYLVNRGQCLAVSGRLDEAIGDLDAAIRKMPELAPVVRDARVGMRIRRGGALLLRRRWRRRDRHALGVDLQHLRRHRRAGEDALQAVDRLQLDATAITGNRELPKVMSIVPWKAAEPPAGPDRPMGSLIDEVLAPLDRDEFRREITYFRDLTSQSTDRSLPGAKEP